MDAAVEKAVKISAAAAEICEITEKGSKCTEVVKIIGRLLTEMGPVPDTAGS